MKNNHVFICTSLLPAEELTLKETRIIGKLVRIFMRYQFRIFLLIKYNDLFFSFSFSYYYSITSELFTLTSADDLYRSVRNNKSFQLSRTCPSIEPYQHSLDTLASLLLSRSTSFIALWQDPSISQSFLLSFISIFGSAETAKSIRWLHFFSW